MTTSCFWSESYLFCEHLNYYEKYCHESKMVNSERQGTTVDDFAYFSVGKFFKKIFLFIRHDCSSVGSREKVPFVPSLETFWCCSSIMGGTLHFRENTVAYGCWGCKKINLKFTKLCPSQACWTEFKLNGVQFSYSVHWTELNWTKPKFERWTLNGKIWKFNSVQVHSFFTKNKKKLPKKAKNVHFLFATSL